MFDLAEEVEQVGEELLHAKGIHPNVDRVYVQLIVGREDCKETVAPRMIVSKRLGERWYGVCLYILRKMRMQTS